MQEDRVSDRATDAIQKDYRNSSDARDFINEIQNDVSSHAYVSLYSRVGVVNFASELRFKNCVAQLVHVYEIMYAVLDLLFMNTLILGNTCTFTHTHTHTHVHTHARMHAQCAS